MNESDTAPSALPEQATRNDEPRWPARWTFVTSWLMPARTARRTAHVSLKSAYLVHLFAAFLAVFLVVFLAAWGEASIPLSLTSVMGEFINIFGNIIHEFEQQGQFFLVAVCATALGTELGFAALAFLIMPWGARDEPLRSSYRHALRRTWLQTPHVLLAIVLIGTPAITRYRAEQAWERAAPWPQAPIRPTNAAPDSQELQDYNEAMRQYRKQWEAYLGKLPWYVKFQEGIVALSVMIAAVWGLWALLRAVGAARAVPPIDRPPMCDTCGYNLTTIAVDSRCPECGEAVAASLGPDARSGTAWEHTRGTTCLSAWWHCSAEAIRNPARLGRRLRLSPLADHHRRLWLIHLPMLFFLAPFFFLACMSLAMVPNPRGDPVEVFLFVLPVLGSIAAAGLFFFGLFAAAVEGLAASLRQKRNLLPYAMQIASYLGGFFVLWTIFAGVLGYVVILAAEDHWFRALEGLVGIDDDVLAFFTWLVPNAACAFWYCMLVVRGTAATRYANR